MPAQYSPYCASTIRCNSRRITKPVPCIFTYTLPLFLTFKCDTAGAKYPTALCIVITTLRLSLQVKSSLGTTNLARLCILFLFLNVRLHCLYLFLSYHQIEATLRDSLQSYQLRLSTVGAATSRTVRDKPSHGVPDLQCDWTEYISCLWHVQGRRLW